MNAFTPVDSHSAAADLSALLQLLTDPVATKARLDELCAQEAATKEQIATLNAMAAETRRLHSTAMATGIVLENRRTALDKREEELEAIRKHLVDGGREKRCFPEEERGRGRGERTCRQSRARPIERREKRRRSAPCKDPQF
jgi:hypothetical protein